MEADPIRVITVGFSNLHPYCVPNYDSRGNVTRLLGNHGRMIDSILQFYNWSARYLKSDEDGFGIGSGNGSWSSVMGFLTRNEVDISPPFHMSLERSSATKFSFPVLFEEVTFATRAPGYLSKVFVIVKPFTPTVWAVCLFTVISIGILMSVMSGFMKRKSEGHVNPPFQNLIGFLVTPGAYADDVFKTNRSSWRLAIFSWSLFVLIASVTYSGTLTSFMTSPLEGEPIDKLETLVELVNEKNYYAGSLPGLAMNDLVQIAASSKNVKLKRPERTRSAAKDRKDATWRMLNERYAFVWLRFWFADIFLEMGEKALREFHVASDTLSSMLLALGLSQKSKLKDKIDRVVLIELETGLIPKWTEDILVQSRIEGLRLGETSQDQLDEKEGLGYAISLLVFINEFNLFNLQRNDKNKRK